MPEVSYLERAKTIGVDSFWYKEVSEEPILELMDRTMAGENIYPDKTPSVSFGNIKSTDLSEREIAVLREVILGYTNAEIAERLNISQYTVRDYIQVLMEKTGYRTRTELAVKARESLTNAVHHAKATKLTIRIYYHYGFAVIEYTNDGIQPEQCVSEGGGLSSLRQSVESAGGTMEIDSFPRFMLRLKIPSKEAY